MGKLSKIKQVQKRLAENGNFDVKLFDEPENQIIKSSTTFFDMLTFGTNAIVQVDESIYDWCVANLSKMDPKRMMDGENLYNIETMLRENGRKLLGQSVRYLYLDDGKIIDKPLGFTYKTYNTHNISEIQEYKGFHNALNYKNDVIAIGAFHENELVALAGADDTLSDLWQIGIDTIPAYRNRGLGVYLVKAITDEIVNLGKLPFYTTWSANIPSSTIALKTGYFPTWVGYYATNL